MKNTLERSKSILDNKEECISKLEETGWITQSEEEKKKKSNEDRGPLGQHQEH